MSRPLPSVLLILILSTIIAYEGYFIFKKITSPQSVRFDDKVEKPEILDLEAIENEYKKSNSNPSISRKSKRTKPVGQSKYLYVTELGSDQFQYSKEDYLAKVKSKNTNFSDFLPHLTQNILEPETVIEKSLLQASTSSYESLFNSQIRSQADRDMERFAIKIELPEMNEGTKFTLQYREPPDFGRKVIPSIALPVTKVSSESSFRIEKTKAYDSPWNNFSSSYSFP